jgi:hypothetical protein
MKTIKLSLPILLLVFASQIKAEKIKHVTKIGWLSTYNDFVHHKMIYEMDNNTSAKGKLIFKSRLDSLQDLRNIKKHHPSKKEAYGYINYKNENYRFYKNTAYKIVDTAGFFIYYLYKDEPALNGKGIIKTDEYFFSTKGDTTIEPFTVDNLKKAFPEKHQFHYDMDALFKSDKDLLLYDNFTHSYKIKYLFLHSVL